MRKSPTGHERPHRIRGRRVGATPERVRTLALPVTVLLLLVFYPNYYQDLFNGLGGGTTGQLAPTVPTMVVMCVYVMMALGLNVVVGYAGLLDLGYVAFYAAGAYIAGWFATLQFAPHEGPLPVGRRAAGAAGPALQRLAAPDRRRGLRDDARHHHRPADPAAAGRLPGDRDARVRRDHPAGREQRRRLVRPQRHERAERTDADRLARLRRARSTTRRRSCRRATGSRSTRPTTTTGPGSSLVLFTLFCCIRLRDSRLGRAWVAIREDEIAAAAMGVPLMRTKTLGVRHRRVLRRRGRAASTRSSRARPSRRTSRSTSRSRCSAW